MNVAEIKVRVDQAFADAMRPKRFTGREHFEECAEHDDTLRSFDRDTIGLERLGNPGWDPMCFVLPEAFQYYFPALVQLALESHGSDGYLNQFFFHVTYDSHFAQISLSL